MRTATYLIDRRTTLKASVRLDCEMAIGIGPVEFEYVPPSTTQLRRRFQSGIDSFRAHSMITEELIRFPTWVTMN